MNAQTEYKPIEYDPGADIVQQYANESIERLREICANWINTAAMHARNEDYWRERALRAESKADAQIADWGH